MKSSSVKHAYIFTINGNLPVVNTCLQMLDYDSNDFYILCDSKWADADKIKSKLIHLNNAHIRYIDSVIINWGGYSQVSSVIQLLNEVLKSSINYAYVHFLQGSDLPIKSNENIIDFFIKNKGVEFVNVDNSDSGILWAEHCCRYRYYLSHNRFYRNSKLIKGLNLLIAKFQRILGISQHKNVRFYYGSALFSITLDFAKYIVSQKDYIYKLFRWSLAPDEKFIQTILMNSPYALNLYSEDSTTSNAFLIDWSKRDHNSPRVWKLHDIDQLTIQPEGVCYARKFIADIDMNVVDELKRRILSE